jgi:hypothetical protein
VASGKAQCFGRSASPGRSLARPTSAVDAACAHTAGSARPAACGETASRGVCSATPGDIDVGTCDVCDVACVGGADIRVLTLRIDLAAVRTRGGVRTCQAVAVTTILRADVRVAAVRRAVTAAVDRRVLARMALVTDVCRACIVVGAVCCGRAAAHLQVALAATAAIACIREVAESGRAIAARCACCFEWLRAFAGPSVAATSVVALTRRNALHRGSGCTETGAVARVRTRAARTVFTGRASNFEHAVRGTTVVVCRVAVQHAGP